MTQAQGALARFSYVAESTWGTTPGSPSMKKLGAAVPGESLGGNIAELISNAISSRRDREDARGGEITVQGSIPFELAPMGLGTLLKHALGTNVTTGSEAPYTHTIKTGALAPGLTIEKAFLDVGKYAIFRGCRVDGLQVTINAEGLVTGSIDVMGKSYEIADASLGTPTAVAHNPFAEWEAAVEEGGDSVVLLSYGLTVRNNQQRVPAIGTRYAASLNPGKADITANISMMFESDAALAKWEAETASSLEVTFTSGDDSLGILLPRTKYFGDAIPKIETDQGIVVQMQARAIYDASTSTSCRIVLVNSEATI